MKYENENNSPKLNKEKWAQRFSVIKKSKFNSIRAFFLALYLIAVIALMPFLRPSYSESEKRQLQTFPKLSIESLSSGDFFDQLNLWYSDTFPARETLLKFNSLFRKTTIGGKTKLYGNVDELQSAGDEIPETSSNSTSSTESVPEKVEKIPENTEKVDPMTPQPFPNVKPNNVETVGALMVVDDTAYELYNFDRQCADKYAYAVSRVAQQLKGQATVYSMIIPTSIGVMVPDNILKKYNVNSSDQHKAIDYLYGKMSSRVKTVDVFPILEAHRSEYIYFRTDHHWTARGAYYGYKTLMESMEKKPYSLKHYGVKKYKNFLGTFYSGTNMDPQLAKKPDVIYAFTPKGAQMMYSKYFSNGKVYTQKDAPIIQNADAMSSANKYLAFMGGDRVLDVIKNEKLKKGPVCTVVKDSFGNCLIPYLVDHYKTIYVVDSREFPKADKRKLAKFIRSTKTTDVFFIHNVSSTRGKGFINGLLKFIG